MLFTIKTTANKPKPFYYFCNVNLQNSSLQTPAKNKRKKNEVNDVTFNANSKK